VRKTLGLKVDALRVRRLRRLLVNATLAVLLLAVQVTVVSHLDLDAHSQGSPCALCVGLSVLGGANVAHLAFALPDATSPAPEQDVYLPPASAPRRFQPARAPPLAS
jgi:hypothetical protein